MKHISFLLFIFSIGCQPVEVADPIITSIDVTIESQEEWLIEGTYDAQDFWSFHGVNINISDSTKETSGVTIKQGSLDFPTVGIFFPSNNTIVVDSPDTRSILTSCVLAHEIGHALGMKHVEEKYSLMSTTNLPGSNCQWSDSDHKELVLSVEE